jgi:hypothetical protein
MKRIFHKSSDRVNAYNALQVRPSFNKLEESRYSSRTRIASSDRALKSPMAVRRSQAAVRPFPLGLTPRGWQGVISWLSDGNESRTLWTLWLLTYDEELISAAVSNEAVVDAGVVTAPTRLGETDTGTVILLKVLECLSNTDASANVANPPSGSTAGVVWSTAAAGEDLIFR